MIRYGRQQTPFYLAPSLKIMLMQIIRNVKVLPR